MKKKIYIIGVAVLGLLASCSSDSEYKAVAENTINITSAQTSLGPNVSEGSVTVDCVPIEAYTNEPSWLSASIEGNTVKLVSTANDTRESRNAKLIIKKATNDSVVVNVSQYGLVLTMDQKAIIINNDQAGTFTKACSSNTEIKLLDTPDWVKATIDGDNKQVTVDVKPNTTGHLRTCYVKYQAAAVVDSFMVKQFDFDKDIVGLYAFGYYDFNEDQTGLELQVVEANIDRNALTVPEWGFSFPITVDDEEGSISIQSNQFLGKIGKYYAYPLFVDRQGSAYYNNGTGLITCPFTYDDELGTSGFFTGSAFSFDGVEADGFLGMLICIFKAKVPSYSNYVGNWGWIISPYVWKVTEDSPATMVKARKYAPVIEGSTLKRINTNIK